MQTHIQSSNGMSSFQFFISFHFFRSLLCINFKLSKPINKIIIINSNRIELISAWLCAHIQLFAAAVVAKMACYSRISCILTPISTIQITLLIPLISFCSHIVSLYLFELCIIQHQKNPVCLHSSNYTHKHKIMAKFQWIPKKSVSIDSSFNLIFLFLRSFANIQEVNSLFWH